MSISLNILTALKPNFPEPEVVLGQPGRINVEQWRQAAERAGDRQVGCVLDTFPEKITRNDIIWLRHADPGIQRRQVAIASLMWGYGIWGVRWGDRWVSDVSEFLGPGLDADLETCDAHLADGKIAEAYKRFTQPAGADTERERHRGIGSSFFTKILYFLARNARRDDSAQYPLILDTKVSMALAQMTGYRMAVRPESYRPRPDPEAYARFVTMMHAWADRLDVTAEVIEYYLWTEAGKPDSALWKACMTQRDLDFP